MNLNFFTILTIISIFITSILLLFFLINKKGFILENRLLALLLLVFDLQIFYSFTTSYYAWQVFMDWHKLLFIVRQTSFLIGPLLYFYVNAFLKKKEFTDWHSLVHFLPFAAVVLSITFFLSGKDHFVIWESELDLITTILILVHNLTYIVLSLMSMRTGKEGIKDFYRNILSTSQNRWIQLLLIGFILTWVVKLNCFALFMIIRRPGWCAYTDSIYGLTFFLFINAVMLVLMYRPDSHYIITKYKNTRIPEPDKMEYLQKLNDYMEKEKPYFNPDITLETLAGEISLNPRFLSQIINETYNKNFKSYILEYRIKESMKILADEKHARLTVLEILYQVGFNSKSAFNNQFKIYTSLTPLEYRSRAIR